MGTLCGMASYAPLLAHGRSVAVEAGRHLVLTICIPTATPDYYVQKVFAGNVGTRIVPVTPQGRKAALYTSASLDERKS